MVDTASGRREGGVAILQKVICLTALVYHSCFDELRDCFYLVLDRWFVVRISGIISIIFLRPARTSSPTNRHAPIVINQSGFERSQLYNTTNLSSFARNSNRNLTYQKSGKVNQGPPW